MQNAELYPPNRYHTVAVDALIDRRIEHKFASFCTYTTFRNNPKKQQRRADSIEPTQVYITDCVYYTTLFLIYQVFLQNLLQCNRTCFVKNKKCHISYINCKKCEALPLFELSCNNSGNNRNSAGKNANREVK